MANHQFEFQCECIQDHFEIEGGMDVIEVTKPTQPTSLIRTDQAWKARFNWTQSGDLCEHFHLDSKWKLRLYFEQMGEGEFEPTNPHEVEKNYEAVDGHEYETEIELAKGSVPEGTYRLVATLRLYDENDKPMPVAAFADGQILQFYVP